MDIVGVIIGGWCWFVGIVDGVCVGVWGVFEFGGYIVDVVVGWFVWV